MRCISGVNKKETENLTKGKETKQKLSRERRNVFSDNVGLNCETKDSSYEISHEWERIRATAAIASSVIQDLGMITEEDMSVVIDKSKIRREIQKARKILLEVESVAVVKAIYFDGRKDNTIVQEKVGAKMYSRVVKEKHISIIHEPDGDYIDHITPMNGTGAEVA
ncbi:hypothetical protein ILUMI_19776 [Ignelater luminosus]|uniref:Uncharacterized protein n=1 Tax=Ignelater luminosus TaxID=2038154 RepID=A0A8K0G595_IGNLU|nr:hypothetical protein ILUMI_19776 [Ignelater luminosus]